MLYFQAYKCRSMHHRFEKFMVPTFENMTLSVTLLCITAVLKSNLLNVYLLFIECNTTQTHTHTCTLKAGTICVYSWEVT